MGWELCICVGVCLGMGRVKVCVIAKLSVRKYARVLIQCLEYRASTRHLVVMNVLVYACRCDPACMRYRSGGLLCAWVQIQIYDCFGD